MNAFEDDKPSLAGDYVSLEDREICCTLQSKRRVKNLLSFLFGICVSVLCVFFYGTVYGFGCSSGPVQTYPGPIQITVSKPISGSSCIIWWEKIYISNNYKLLLFQLAFSDDAQNWEPLPLENAGFDFNRTIEGLRSSSTYIFRLRACAAVGCGNFTYTQCKTKRPSIPETPRAPMATSTILDDEEMYISFDVTSADNGGASITNVELWWTEVTDTRLSNTSLGCSFSRPCASGCNCTVRISMPFVGSETFSFSTQVSNFVGTSNWSVPTQCTIFTDSTQNPICVITAPPAAPERLSYEAESSNVTIKWTNGISVNSDTPVFFEVWLSDPWNERQELIKIRNITYNMYQNNTMLPDTVYKFAVRAFDSVGRPGQMSKSLVFETPICGNCGNHQDVKVLKAQWENASWWSYLCWVQNCNSRVTTDGEHCTELCIERELGFTNSCSKCWFDRTVCLIDDCHCLIYPKKCQTCYNEVCLHTYLNCSGLPSYASPPAKLGNLTQS